MRRPQGRIDGVSLDNVYLPVLDFSQSTCCGSILQYYISLELLGSLPGTGNSLQETASSQTKTCTHTSQRCKITRIITCELREKGRGGREDWSLPTISLPLSLANITNTIA